ncbi:light-regulated signal transduction histidine kinase (bacteriophytochrome) [Paraburkholderia atlantica]
MQKLIEDLLACSRVGTPGATQELASCATALDQALKSLSVVLQESHAQINRDAPPVVMGIPTQLALLFQNLIGNAVKFRRLDQPVRIDIGADVKETNGSFRSRTTESVSTRSTSNAFS